ncbi:MAG TPA: hypothetical protein DCZ94_01545 [Lentisphaeria bacterium]|nr:MAG: hypothetical protein A2X48_21425 [Lentisphaerae bacterium GWF2_49_21]HBC85615.1 hypothetical protein [Lentisphaeria bacterium]
MKSKNALAIIVLALLSTGLMSVLSGCWTGYYGIPEGTKQEFAIGQLHLKATGAGIVTASEQKTTFRIRCSMCGFINPDMTGDTPKMGDTFKMMWACPECAHIQIIRIESSSN